MLLERFSKDTGSLEIDQKTCSPLAIQGVFTVSFVITNEVLLWCSLSSV